MPLKNLLKKKDKIKDEDTHPTPVTPPPGVPEFRIVRTDTNTQEIIQPPTYNEDRNHLTSPKRRSRFHRNSLTSSFSGEKDLSPPSEKGERRLSQRLHLDRRSRSSSATSINVPADLPQIGPDVSDAQEREAQWEKRATILAQGNSNRRPSIGGSSDVMVQEFSSNPQEQRSRSGSMALVNDPEGDV
jgi:hypothetical protein